MLVDICFPHFLVGQVAGGIKLVGIFVCVYLNGHLNMVKGVCHYITNDSGNWAMSCENVSYAICE